MSDLPEHEWYRVAEIDAASWTIRCRIGGEEGVISTEVAMNLPEWPEEGE